MISVLHTGFGIGTADALAYGVILQAVEIATAVALGLPALVREGLTWSDLRVQALSAAPVDCVPLAPPERRRSATRFHAVPARPLRTYRLVLVASLPMALSNIAGFPRIGRNRELKFAPRAIGAARPRPKSSPQPRRRSGSTTGS